MPIPVAAWTKAWVFGSSLAGTAGSNSAGGGHGFLVNAALSGCLCVGVITRPVGSYRMWCAWE